MTGWCQQEGISKTCHQEISGLIWVRRERPCGENISGQICPIVLCVSSVRTQLRSYRQCDNTNRIMEVKIIILLFCHLPSSQSQLQPSFSPLSFLGNIWSTVRRARTLQIFQPQIRSKLVTDDITGAEANVCWVELKCSVLILPF